MSKNIKIALADDEQLIRNGIKALLEMEGGFTVILEAGNGHELIKKLDRNHLPDIVLMDIRMPELNGIETTKMLLEQYPAIKIIALSSYAGDAFINNMLYMGAVGYVVKSAPPEELLKQIHLVIEKGYCLEKTQLTKPFNIELSSREIEILKLICKQCSSTEIAEKLNISPRTVDGHRNNLLLKTESKNIIGLAIYAKDKGLL